MIELSQRITELVDTIFPAQSRNEVRRLLEIECADNIAGCESRDKYGMERIRVSVLKLSGGDLDELLKFIELARIDWRDLFMAAGFGNDPEAHNHWSP